MASWDKMRPSLSEETLSVLQSQGFSCPVHVQAVTIPKFLSNKDVAVQAMTGSGKTLAFVIPLIEILKRRKEPWKQGETGGVVILPTRELAVQVAEVLRLFLPPSYTLRLLIGGTDVAMDIRSINTDGATIVVATPGRLADLLEKRACHLAAFMKSLEVLVLDEADRLLDLGFEPVINSILEYLPKQRRTGLFSATLTQEVSGLVRAGLRNPVTISISSDQDESIPKSLNNFYLECSTDIKLTALVSFLSKHKSEKIIVFLATCAGVSYFSTIVQNLVPDTFLLALHGKMRHKRQKLFDTFTEMEKGVLMCTDVMARGIDVPDVDWVVQFDPPSSAKSFIHRCGRTARMGRSGNALVFLLPSESAYIQYLNISQNITLSVLPDTVNEDDIHHVLESTMAMLCKDRELYDASIRAYVSFVRFYHKHELQLIFRLKDLDLPGLARGTYALLHLPKMPELRGHDASSFTPHSISVEDIPFKSKQYERKCELTKLEKEVAWNARQKQRKLRQKIKSKKEKKLIKQSKKHKRQQFSVDELEELAKDARLIKKFKAGKITKETLNNLLDC